MKSFLLIAIFLGLVLQASASSHSEAPGTAKKPSSDITDFYMFKSPTNADNLILALGVSGLQNPNAGPNWYTFSDQHFFEFHLVCDAESVDSAHVFQFYFGSRYNGNGPAVDYPNDYDYSQCGLGQPADTTPSVALDIGSAGDVQSVEIPLKVFLPLYNAQTGAININLINSVESYHFNYYQNVPAPAGANDFGTPTVVTHGSNNDNTFRVPFTYVGDKTFGQPENYASYADQFIYTTNNFLTCGNTPESVRVFAGPRQEPFFIDLGRTFDLLNFNPPIIGTGQSGTIRNCPENNDIIQHNVNYIVLEVPICAIECGVSPNVLGAWTAVRELLHNNGNDHVPGAITNRFGNPLINELIIGIGDKQSWNYDHPYNEADFALYYKYPVVPAFINLLFPSVTPPDVPVGGRVDLYELLLKGIPGLNRVNSSGNSLVTVTPSDLLRINLGSVSETNTQSYSALGVIGGDFAGYPNGRRLFDDVVDITLRAAMGALCNNAFNGGFGCFESNAPFWDTAFGDGVSSDPADYLSVFPFVNYPNPGAVANPHPRQCSSASSSAFALMTLFATFFVFLF